MHAYLGLESPILGISVALIVDGSYPPTPPTHRPSPRSSNAQQAAKKQAEILNDPNCPFQHNTCSKCVRSIG